MKMESDMLFKIGEDPFERNNLISLHKEKAAELKAFIKPRCY